MRQRDKLRIMRVLLNSLIILELFEQCIAGFCVEV